MDEAPTTRNESGPKTADSPAQISLSKRETHIAWWFVGEKNSTGLEKCSGYQKVYSLFVDFWSAGQAKTISTNFNRKK